MQKFNTVDEYIDSFPKDLQKILLQIRKLIKDAAPEAEESMSYGMPGYKLNKRPLVYFAAFKSHIGFYPTPSGVTEFAKELSSYQTSKGTAQFPLDQPMPLALIKKIVDFRMKENQKK